MNSLPDFLQISLNTYFSDLVDKISDRFSLPKSEVREVIFSSKGVTEVKKVPITKGEVKLITNYSGGYLVLGDTFNIKDELKSKFKATWKVTAEYGGCWIVPNQEIDPVKKYLSSKKKLSMEKYRGKNEGSNEVKSDDAPDIPDDEIPEERILSSSAKSSVKSGKIPVSQPPVKSGKSSESTSSEKSTKCKEKATKSGDEKTTKSGDEKPLKKQKNLPNKFGNFIDKEHDVVIYKIDKEYVAIGTQMKTSSDVGLDSVKPLTQKKRDSLLESNVPILTKKLLKSLDEDEKNKLLRFV